MGSGIAQLATTKGHTVVAFEANAETRARALPGITKNLEQRRDRGKLSQAELDATLSRLTIAGELNQLSGCEVIVEAIVENLEVKQQVFRELELLVAPTAILATNTSSLSVTSIAAACTKRERVAGLHFFNPAPLMPLVEIVPTEHTSTTVVQQLRALAESWGKSPVVAKDSPGFIVNRIARPYYGESLRLLEEGVADVATIDWALKTAGGFSMGPFELMDLIGNDINLAVSETVFKAFKFSPRFALSPIQQEMVREGRLGKKVKHGFYDYRDGATNPMPKQDETLAESIFTRVISMLINEAVDAYAAGVASRDDIDTAMQKGVNYPKGLLRWGDELGLGSVRDTLQELVSKTGDERYRPTGLLIEMAERGSKFYG
jgi:3-hydroxybutyryl-CoA dehydrogenase